MSDQSSVRLSIPVGGVQVIGVNTLYNTACPHLSFNIGVEGEGDQFGWYFDTNDDCAVSLLVLLFPYSMSDGAAAL